MGRIRVVVVFACLAAVLASVPQAEAKRPPPAPPAVTFAGYQWTVKSSSGKVGPGPNVFSAAGVSVDADGRLHLRIARERRTWTSAEVIAPVGLGHGTYRWTVSTSLGTLDPNVVLGLFTWSDNPVQAHRELDIEVARWGSSTDPTNAQYVVQPYDVAGHLQRYTHPAGGPSVLELRWQPGRVDFSSTVDGATVASWSYTGADVPTPGDERARMNLWLFQGRAPINGQPVEVVFTDFDFVPA